jgi:predicted Fe-Mo cluster-binding NifX family protein
VYGIDAAEAGPLAGKVAGRCTKRHKSVERNSTGGYIRALKREWIMKIAVAVEADKTRIAKRMGHAPWFAVYELSDGRFRLLELVANAHAGETHEHGADQAAEVAHHRQHLAPLKGIDGFLSRAVGAHMKQALQQEGIPVYRLPLAAGKTAPEVLEYFNAHLAEKASFLIA